MNENDMQETLDQVRQYLLEEKNEMQLVRLHKLQFLLREGFVPRHDGDVWLGIIEACSSACEAITPNNFGHSR